jgi:hypothetical protein
MAKLSPDHILYNRPRPGPDYLLVQFLFLAVLVIIPQIQCRTGCFVWTPWRIAIFGLIYLGLLWYIADAFHVKYLLTKETLEIRALILKKRLNIRDIREIHYLPGYPFKRLAGWSGRNFLNRYHNLVLLITREGHTYILSPRNPEQFADELRKYTGEKKENSHGE